VFHARAHYLLFKVILSDWPLSQCAKHLIFPYVPLRCHPWIRYISMDRALRKYTKAGGITTCASEMLTSSVLPLSGLDTLVMYQDDWYDHTYH
jgi:hypothetical protein